MNNNSVPEKLILAGIIFYPLQVFTLPVYGSVFDASIFLILLATILIAFRNFKIRHQTFIWLLFFACSQVIIFSILQVAPLYRLINGLIWFGGLVLVFLSRNLFEYKKEFIAKLIIVNLLISAVYCFVTAGIEGLFSRPQAWFSEPSFAGLSFYSASAGLFGVLMLLKAKLSVRMAVFMLALIFFLAGLLTLSMHVVAFGVVIFLVLTLRLSLKQLPVTILIISLFAGLLMLLLEMDHFSSRVQVTGEVSNLSTLAWLYGHDQMLSAVSLSPLFGMGLGSTGYFPFDSEYADIMSRSNVGILNVTDAYSAFFRIVIELGVPFTFFLSAYLCSRYIDFKRYIAHHMIHHSHHFGPTVFLFIFSMTMTIGILIKEPTFSRSFVYIAWLILVSCLPMEARIHNQKEIRE